MSTTLEFVEGPLFRVAILLFTLGFLRLSVLWWLKRRSETSGRRLRAEPRPMTTLDGIATAAMHAGVVLTAVFLADHVVAWGGGLWFPVLPHLAADVLAFATMAIVLAVFVYRVYQGPPRSFAAGHRLLAVLWFCLLTGYFASHPEESPIPWEPALVLHVVSAELFLISVPFTSMGIFGRSRVPTPAPAERKLEEVAA